MNIKPNVTTKTRSQYFVIKPTATTYPRSQNSSTCNVKNRMWQRTLRSKNAIRRRLQHYDWLKWQAMIYDDCTSLQFLSLKDQILAGS